MNNTYNNAKGGIKVSITGNSATSFANAVNNANIFGVTANVTSGNINIIYSVPGPIFINETDAIDTPLANAGIVAGEYGFGATSFVISGTKPNPTFNSNSYFGLGINWNAILNSYPQSQRRFIKEIWIAQLERQKVGTPSYRPLNVFINTVSPTIGHPWEL
jgi:hypothetical protein